MLKILNLSFTFTMLQTVFVKFWQLNQFYAADCNG